MSSYRDKFLDRLMIPISDKYGQIVGFTGRSLPSDKPSERPKYLNSPDSPWFKKGDLWFGYPLAKSSIRQQKKALIVEGHMDVIAAHKFGLDFTLASQGTSFTPSQLKQLKQLTSTVWLAFDNDEAGILASKKFFKMAAEMGLEVHKVLIPEKYKDLDEFLPILGKENLPQKLETMPFLEFTLGQKNSLLLSQNSEQQKAAVLEMIDLISSLDKISQEQNLKKLSSLTEISQETLAYFLKESQKNKSRIREVLLPERENSIDNILISVQRLGAWQSADLLPPSLQTKLNQAFVFLKKLSFGLKEYRDFDHFAIEKKSSLEFIYEQELSKNKETDLQPQPTWEKLKKYLNISSHKLFLSEHEKSIYAEIWQ